MPFQAFLILKTDNTAWVLTHEPDSKVRALYEFHAWLLDADPAPAVEPVEPWLEHEGAAIEAAYSIDLENKTVNLDSAAQLEYTELLEDIALY